MKQRAVWRGWQGASTRPWNKEKIEGRFEIEEADSGKRERRKRRGG